MITRGLGIGEVIKKDKIKNKTKCVKIKSLHSVEVGGLAQNAVVAETPAEAEELRL